jgi:hypothetical protein
MLKTFLCSAPAIGVPRKVSLKEMMLTYDAVIIDDNRG